MAVRKGSSRPVKRAQRHPPAEYLTGYFRGQRLRIYKGVYRDFLAGKLTKKKLLKLKARFRNPARATPAVYLFSREHFPLRGLPTEEFVTHVVDWLSRNIKFVKERKWMAQFMYGKQTAEDVLLTERIPSVVAGSGAAWGCGMLCDSLIALLKTFPGIENIKHVRTVGGQTRFPHSVVYFELPFRFEGKLRNKRFVSDPYRHGMFFLGGKPEDPRTISRVGIELGKRIADLKKQGKWREGNSLHDFNKSFMDYEREKL